MNDKAKSGTYKMDIDYYVQKEKIEKNPLPLIQKQKNIKVDWVHIIRNIETPSKEWNILYNIYQKNQKEAENNNEPPVHDDLINLIASPSILMHAHKNIRKNQGVLTPGAAGITADGLSKEVIDVMSEQIKKGKWIWNNPRRIWTPKPGKPGQRPITMPDYTDKIIQEAIRITLECMYEPWFEKLGVSFGFRPRKCCRDAIIRTTGPKSQNMKWAIEGDIKGAYDTVDHQIMLNNLKKRIKDKKLLKLIETGFKTKVFDIKTNRLEENIDGIPQGGIASPILFNIYMHEFDKFIENEVRNYTEKINNKQNRNKTLLLTKQYKRLEGQTTFSRNKIKKYVKKLNKPISQFNTQEKDQLKRLQKIYKKRVKARLNTPSKSTTLNKVRFIYTRYADDWLFLLYGTKLMAEKIKRMAATWLRENLGLELSTEKTLITNIRKEMAHYLGFQLKLTTSRKVTRGAKMTRRVAGWKIRVFPDSKRLAQRFLYRGYVNEKMKPKEYAPLSLLHPHTIIERYNSVIRGMGEYYFRAITNPETMTGWIYILRWSCIKTLALKYRTTVRQICKKYYSKKEKTIEVKYNIMKRDKKTGAIQRESNSQTLLTWKKTKELVYQAMEKETIGAKAPKLPDPDFMKRITWANWRSKASFMLLCCICGSDKQIEMHHVKHVKKGEIKGFTKIMSNLNRRQVPVCKCCHNKIHAGKYDGPELTKLFDTRLVNIENYIGNPNYKWMTKEEVIQITEKLSWIEQENKGK